MKRRVLALLLALSAPALALIIFGGNPEHLRPIRQDRDGIIIVGNPDHLHPIRQGLRPPARPASPAPGTPPRLQGWSAPLIHAVAVYPDGSREPIPLPAGQDLADPIPVPAEPVADLELTLGGPLALRWNIAGVEISQASKDLDPLTVAVEDPEVAAERGSVTLDLSDLSFLGDPGDAALLR